jgi:hypothetical protein
MREGREVPNPDAAAGLYIRDRAGRAVRAAIPPDHLAFQMGQSMQVPDLDCKRSPSCLPP